MPHLDDEPLWSCFPCSGFLDSGYVCIDGSGLDQELSTFARAGYAAVGVDVGGNIMGSLYGPLPHLLQMSGCGEVFALLVALRHIGATPTVIATDCKMVLDIWNAGPAQDLTNV